MDNTIEKAKEYITDYVEREFEDSEPDFSDLKNVSLAYTTLTDNEIPIQIDIDLINMQFKTYIDNGDEPVKIESASLDELETMDFDILIAGWQGYIEEHMEEYM
jgi:hypothetical protein